MGRWGDEGGIGQRQAVMDSGKLGGLSTSTSSSTAGCIGSRLDDWPAGWLCW